MATYTVQAAAKKKDVPDAKFGPAQVITLTLVNGDSDQPVIAEWFTKATTPLPQAGASIEGDVTPGQFGNDFKKANSGGFPGGGGRGDSPEVRRSIAMQHAQKCAVEALRVAAQFGDYHPPTAGEVAGQVKTIARVLFDQVEEVSGT